DTAIRAAPAHVHDLVDVGVGGAPFGVEQRRGLHDLPRLAEPTLRTVPLKPRLLDRVQAPLGSEAFDRGDLLSDNISRSEHAHLNRTAVHVARARAAHAYAASVLRPRHAEQVAHGPAH